MRDELREHLGEALSHALDEISSNQTIKQLNAMPPAERQRYMDAIAKRQRRRQRNLAHVTERK